MADWVNLEAHISPLGLA